MSNNGRKRLRGTAAAQANGPHEDAATGVVPPAAQAAAVLPAVAGGILAAAAPHALAVPRVVIPSGCHLFGKPATIHDGTYTVPIRLAVGDDWIDSYSSFIARKQKTTPFAFYRTPMEFHPPSALPGVAGRTTRACTS